jgi:hypothetical protein
MNKLPLKPTRWRGQTNGRGREGAFPGKNAFPGAALTSAKHFPAPGSKFGESGYFILASGTYASYTLPLFKPPSRRLGLSIDQTDEGVHGKADKPLYAIPPDHV